MASPIPMPARGERAAPTFDKAKPREIGRFFDEIEYLFDRAKITAEDEKKRQLLRYVDFETEQIWKSFPEFKSPLSTYAALKAAILVHYPDAAGDHIFSIRDMDLLIGERQRLGITSVTDLTNYHLQFLAVTGWLMDNDQLGDLEQRRAYTRAFSEEFKHQVNNRLQLKKPDQHPNIPYKVLDVYDAARYVLQSATPVTTSLFSATNVISSAAIRAPIKQEPAIKQEDLRRSLLGIY